MSYTKLPGILLCASETRLTTTWLLLYSYYSSNHLTEHSMIETIIILALFVVTLCGGFGETLAGSAVVVVIGVLFFGALSLIGQLFFVR